MTKPIQSLPPVLQVARVDFAFACNGLMDMVGEKAKKMAEADLAMAVMQRYAEAFDRVC